MPYRINPQEHREIQVMRGRKWRRLKLHQTAALALSHLRALKMNVKEIRHGNKTHV